MKRLMCLVLLVLILPGLLFGQNERSLKESMLIELNFLRKTFISISQELEKTEIAFQESLKANSEDSKRLKEEIKSLKAEKQQVERRLSKLEQDYKLLNDSKDSWAKLNKNYDTEIEILEGQVRLWQIIGIAGGAVAVGTLTYLIVTAVKDAVKDRN